MKHSAHGLTPSDACRPANQAHVKMMLERKRRIERQYKTISVGDMVKLFVKKKTFTKQHIPVWTEN